MIRLVNELSILDTSGFIEKKSDSLLVLKANRDRGDFIVLKVQHFIKGPVFLGVLDVNNIFFLLNDAGVQHHSAHLLENVIHSLHVVVSAVVRGEALELRCKSHWTVHRWTLQALSEFISKI